MTRSRKVLGERGESAAITYLTGIGYCLLAKNYRRRGGELDLVLRDDDTLVFCEVKTSQSGSAFESFTARQQKRQRALILNFVAGAGWEGPIRVDLVALERQTGSSSFKLHHFQDVLSTDF